MPEQTSASVADFHRRSIEDREGFWAEQARLIEWRTPPAQICDHSNPPFARWFAGGTTNLCHNAVDRHLAERAGQPALVAISTETGSERSYSYAELHTEVQRVAAMLQALGVRRGDRVLIYMPMVAEAPSPCWPARASARCIAWCSAASPPGRWPRASTMRSRWPSSAPMPVRAAARSCPTSRCWTRPCACRATSPAPCCCWTGDWPPCRCNLGGTMPGPPCAKSTWTRRCPANGWMRHTQLHALHQRHHRPPKGVQRDTGGYAVALAASMRHLFDARAGQVFFATSDIGWVVGHSYIVYGPLLAGMTTIFYEGLPTRPDAGVWWSIVERHKVTHMFSAPTAVRVLKKQDAAHLARHDVSSLKALWLAGEPLDAPTAAWIGEALGVPIIDNYWQTETGWPILTLAMGVAPQKPRLGSPGRAVYGYDVKLIDESTGEELTEPGQKGVLAIDGPLPPGCMQTVWRDDERFVNTYWKSLPGPMRYSTFDWGIRDADGYYFILGRTDDVINVAGHRLGTREIEESIAAHPGIAEVAVVGVADAVKGQVAMAFAVPRDAAALADPEAARRLEGEAMQQVDGQLGAVARPSRVFFVSLLPKTRSGKLLRRALQAVAERRDPGDLTTLDDPAALQQVKDLMG